jgi:hypothetical protein
MQPPRPTNHGVLLLSAFIGGRPSFSSPPNARQRKLAPQFIRALLPPAVGAGPGKEIREATGTQVEKPAAARAGRA